MNVNPDHQALDADGKVIPGLYLAGNTAGGFFANDYPTMVAGISHGRALTFGFIAGKNAASETL
jgi:fumarate reductase flavoprotein subunit